MRCKRGEESERASEREREKERETEPKRDIERVGIWGNRVKEVVISRPKKNYYFILLRACEAKIYKRSANHY